MHTVLEERIITTGQYYSILDYFTGITHGGRTPADLAEDRAWAPRTHMVALSNL